MELLRTSARPHVTYARASAQKLCGLCQGSRTQRGDLRDPNTPIVASHLRESSSREVVDQKLLTMLRLQSGVGLPQLWQRHAWATLYQLHLQA